uniref:Testicular acid phosphatase homolog n=1 Tax=Culex pipiens TaxID=7175 RepID=A0A8D8K5E8_CULPI
MNLAVLFSIVIVLFETRPTNSQLQMVLALFRHGVRSPIVTFPTDPHANYPWVGGMESLQPKGLVQLYELGQSMRARYKFLFPDHVANRKQKIYAVSSASQRCIDSAQSFLAGFLQTTTGINGSVVPKQPVPLHIIPGDQDAVRI